MIKDLLLDFLDILFPILLYQFIVLTKPVFKRSPLKNKIFLGMLCGIAITLSMLLPSPISNDLDGDLRNIPLIISLLYGGFIGGAISFTCFSISRFLIDLQGFLHGFFSSFVTAALVCAVTSIFVPQFHKRTPKNRFFIVMGLWFVTFMATLCALMNQSQASEMNMFLVVQVGLLQLAAMCMSVFLMEVTIHTNTMQEQILHSEKLSIAGHLASSVAHELRSPLTVIKGFIQLALRDTEGKTKHYLETTVSELKRVEYVIDDYLNYAKPQLEKVEVLSLADVFHQMNELIYPLSQTNNVRVEMNSEGNLWVRADKSKLIQALNNVVKNSIEASKSQQGIVSIHAYQVDQLDVCIKICDNGCGMSGEELDKLGTPFYSTQNNGTGLGLMVTCKIIKAFDGKIDFKSEKGKGTEVSILMPMITNC
ncbi:hypothetical protein AV654_32475 [Paenibacillus elgii]|uniref:histidine kinase n=1 Tax=Paenibacillus elgii TaxID=189691 RepID=A0A161S3H5_9BACL|nr:ATP-binding protein [Paenibacillus elgii]KZE73395.1 hypothetical protein AV654_32475 [Paenibacillus elgii]